jgi:anthranilate phosphoribosyltransferase
MTELRFADAFAHLVADRLNQKTVRGVFDAIFAGAWTPIQVAGFIAALRARGESAETIAAAAGALRDAMVRVEHGLPRLLDTCGTGGDGLGTVNLSTGAAILVAASGVPVAKHGNRAASSRSGSADVLDALGIPLNLPPTASAELLREVGIAFLLAPAHHPAMRHAAEARSGLGIRTIFNFIGPLANPASATHQLVGAPDQALRPLLAETLRALGSQRAWVAMGDDGLDEISPSGPTRVSVVTPTSVTEIRVTPEDFGLEAIPLSAIAGGDPQENAAILASVLAGEPHPSRNGFVLNAAAALVVSDDLAPRAARDRIEETLATGKARQKLDQWREAALAKKAKATLATG